VLDRTGKVTACVLLLAGPLTPCLRLDGTEGDHDRNASACQPAVDYDPAVRTYTPPAEHTACLSGHGSLDLAQFSKATTVLA
jgi:hypothetical protein